MNAENKLKQMIEDTVVSVVSPKFDIISRDNKIILQQIQYILSKEKEPGIKLNKIAKLIDLYKGSIKGVNSKLNEMGNDITDRFRPIFSLDVNHSSLFRLTASFVGKDEYSLFYFDEDLILIPEKSRIQTEDFGFMRDMFVELVNTKGIDLFKFLKEGMLQTGLIFPAPKIKKP